MCNGQPQRKSFENTALNGSKVYCTHYCRRPHNPFTLVHHLTLWLTLSPLFSVSVVPRLSVDGYEDEVQGAGHKVHK